jgi:hypothetical protein
MTKHPTNDWKFVDDIEESFVEWFNADYGPYTWRCEYFFGDCKVEDEKTRKDLMYKWVHAAFQAGYERAQYATLESQQLGGTE